MDPPLIYLYQARFGVPVAELDREIMRLQA
jgi:hypothetical protein